MDVLTEVASARTYRKGDRIFRRGEPVDGFHVVLEGYVKIVRPGTVVGDQVVAVSGPGDLFGTDACSGFLEHRTDALALRGDTLVAAVTCDRLKELAQRAPGVALALSQVLAARVTALEEQLEQVMLPAQARLARAFLALAQRFGLETEPGIFELSLDLKHHEIASLASVTRVSVSQALASWRGLGIVQGTRGVYCVDAPKLVALLEVLEFEHLG